MKVPFIIYVDLESSLEKMNTCHNNPEKSSTTKINKHTPSGYSLFTHCSFDATKNKLDYYSGKNCQEKFCKDLKEQKKEGKYIVCKKFVIYAKKDLVLMVTMELNSIKSTLK